MKRRRRPPLRARLRREVVWEYLTRHNLTLNGFARRAGIDPSYMSQMMNGRQYPSARMRALLQAALGIDTFDDLFILEQCGEE